jgi:hypothetical protein
MLEINRALDALASENPNFCRVIEMHYFGGMAAEEIALPTGRSVHIYSTRIADRAGMAGLRAFGRRIASLALRPRTSRNAELN